MTIQRNVWENAFSLILRWDPPNVSPDKNILNTSTKLNPKPLNPVRSFKKTTYYYTQLKEFVKFGSWTQRLLIFRFSRTVSRSRGTELRQVGVPLWTETRSGREGSVEWHQKVVKTLRHKKWRLILELYLYLSNTSYIVIIFPFVLIY